MQSHWRALLFALLLCLLNQVAVAQKWQWVQKAGGSDWDMGQDIAVDDAGNSYVTGSFYRMASFDAISLSSSIEAENFLAKYDEDGNIVWAEQIGGSRFGQGYKIALDAAGNIYVAGSFAGTVSFGSYTFTNTSGWADLFIAKYSADGKIIWAKMVGKNVEGRDIAVDATGNIYLTGYFLTTTTLGSITIFSNKDSGHDRYTVFVSKFDSNGKIIWAKEVQGNDHDYGYAIATDAAANIYVTGLFIGNASFGEINLTSSNLTNNSYVSFIAKYDSSGKVLWAKQLDVNANAIAVDPAGNSFLTGYFYGSPLVGPVSLTSNGIGDVFLIKLDINGNVLWAKSAGGESSDDGYGVAVDGAGNCFLTGSFHDTAYFEQTTLIGSSNYYDVFVAKYDSNGYFLWAQKASGPYYEAASAISVDVRGNTYLTGRFSETASFDSIPLTSNGSFDMFVAKFGSPFLGPTNIAINSVDASGVCEGAVVKVFFNSSGNFNPDNIFIAQVSDEKGSFFSPINIGGGSVSPIIASIPASISYGAGYRIRVIASSPITIVDDNGINLFKDLKEAGLQIPNIITPNDDGLNESFKFPISCLTIHMKVFNRWGKLVYEQSNYQNTWNGGNLAAGTYYYLLTSDAGQAWKGWVEISR